MLFHSLYEVSIAFGGTVFPQNDVGGTYLNGGIKNSGGGGGSTTNDDIFIYHSLLTVNCTRVKIKSTKNY